MLGRTTIGRHALPRRARRHLLPIALIGAALLATLAVSATAATGGTYASWHKAASSDAGTVTVGSFGFAFRDAGPDGAASSEGSGTGAAEPTPYSFTALTDAADFLLPGSIATAEVEIANTGETPITLTATGVSRTTGTAGASALYAASALAVRPVGPPCTPESFAGTTLRPFGDITAQAPLAVVDGSAPIAAHGTRTVCVAVALSAEADPAAAAQSMTASLTIRADQHRPQ